MTAAGTVLGAAAGNGLEVGQRVIGSTFDIWRGYAEEALIATSLAERLPDEVEPITTVAMHVTYPTAWFGLHPRGSL